MWEITTLLISLLLFILYFLSYNDEVKLFCILTSIFNFIVHFIPDEYGTFAYIGAGLNDLFIILFINKLCKESFLSEALQWLSLIFIPISAFGWRLWLNYEDPYWYSLLANAIYIVALILIFYKGNFKSVGVYIRDIKIRYWDTSTWHTKFFSHIHTSTNKMYSNKIKEEKA